MKRGPKPQPTKLKLAKNTFRKSRQIQNEALPSDDFIRPPEWLDLAGREVWNDHVGHLRAAGPITNVDVTQFALYCQTLVFYKEVIAAYSNNPAMVLQTPAGYAMRNPYIVIARETKKDLYQMAAEFGMTPSSRSRTSASMDPDFDPMNPWANLPGGRRTKGPP